MSRILRWRGYLGSLISAWARVITRILKRGRQKAESQKRRYDNSSGEERERKRGKRRERGEGEG